MWSGVYLRNGCLIHVGPACSYNMWGRLGLPADQGIKGHRGVHGSHLQGNLHDPLYPSSVHGACQGWAHPTSHRETSLAIQDTAQSPNPTHNP